MSIAIDQKLDVILLITSLCTLLVAGCSSQQPSVDASLDAFGHDAQPDVMIDASGDAGDADLLDSSSDTDVEGDESDADLGDGGPCVAFESPVTLGTVESEELGEISGLVASRANPGVLWVHNDSGDRARIFAIDRRGRSLATFQLTAISAYDWEDIAIAQGETNDLLYVGDIGDNARARESITIHRFQEPSVSLEGPPTTGEIAEIETLELAYPEGVAHDAEAFFIDPRSGDLFIVSKEFASTAFLFRAAAPLESGRVLPLELVGEVDVPSMIPMVTGADISATGDSVIVRVYSDVLLWVRPEEGTIASAFESAPRVLPRAAEPQGESVGFQHDSLGYFTISEGVGAEVHYFAAAESCL